MINIFKKTLLGVFLVLFAFTAFGVLQNVNAQEDLGQTTVVPIQINDVQFTVADTTINITATFSNPDLAIRTTPFTYLATLRNINQLGDFTISEVTPEPISVTTKEGAEYQTLNPSSETSISVSLPTTTYLPKDNYELIVMAITKGGDVLGTYSEVIFDLGVNGKTNNVYTDSFLAINQDSCTVITPDGTSYHYNEGPIFQASETPKVQCEVRNIGKSNIELFPYIEQKEFFVYGQPELGEKATHTSETGITFLAGEERTIELELPKETNPQVYQSLLSFKDSNNDTRSLNMPFRWTVGGDSARVDEVTLIGTPKESYEAGETVSLSINYFGSMDLYWQQEGENDKDLTNVKLTAQIKDSKGNVCGEKETIVSDIIDGSADNEVMDIVLSQSCKGIAYSASISSNDKELATAEDILPTPSRKDGGIAMYVMIFLIILIVGFIYGKKYFSKKASIAIFLALAISSSSLLVTTVIAQTTRSTWSDEVIGSSTTRTYTGQKTFEWGGEAFSGTDFEDSSHTQWSLYKPFDQTRNKLVVEYLKADFADYFQGNGAPTVRFEFERGIASGCGNGLMYYNINLALKNGNTEIPLLFSKRGITGLPGFNFTSQWAGTSMDWGYTFDLSNVQIKNLYEEGKLTNDSKIVAYAESASSHPAYPLSYRIGFFGLSSDAPRGAAYANRFNPNATLIGAFQNSDKIKVEVPIKLPLPSVNLLVEGKKTATVSCGGSVRLQWTMSDVDACLAFGGGIGDWSGVKTNPPGSEIISNIQAGKRYILSCVKDMGPLGLLTVNDDVTVSTTSSCTIVPPECNNSIKYDCREGGSVKQSENTTHFLWECQTSGFLNDVCSLEKILPSPPGILQIRLKDGSTGSGNVDIKYTY